MLRCTSCAFTFWERNFDDAERSWLYAHYRSDEYQRSRKRYEPWYTKKVNWAIGNDEVIIQERVRHLTEFLHAQVGTQLPELPERILDVGGDRGQFIPDFLHDGCAPPEGGGRETAKAVFEVSSKEPISGVTKIQSLNEVRRWGPQLVMVCHVLEHLEDPSSLLSNIVDQIEKQTLVYIEVPFDEPGKPARFQSRQEWSHVIIGLTRFRYVSILVDMLSLVLSRWFKYGGSFAILKQSEHVNFFTFNSLTLLALKSNLKVVAQTEYRIPAGYGSVRALGILCYPDI